MAGMKKFLYASENTHWPSEQETDDELTLGGLSMGGDIAMAGNEVTGLPSTPSGDTAAASKAYVDAVAEGLDPKGSCRVVATSNVSPSGDPGSIDDIDIDDGDRVLLTENTNADENGIWIVDFGGAWARPDDFDTGSHAAGAFTFIEEGTDYQDSGWVCTTNGPNDVVDTNDLAFAQFSGAGQITAGAGLSKDGNTIDVNFGDGIRNDSDYVALDLADVNPGLELTGAVANQKELQVLVDGEHGIIRGASGIELEIDDTPDTLDVDADGLKVVGLPSLFKINDVAVGADVTAANMDTLTDGSNADALHSHSALEVDEAKRVEDTHENKNVVSDGDVVRWSDTNDQLDVADNSSVAGGRAIGVARTGGAVSPGTSEVVKHGVCAGCLAGATPNTPYFLGASGALVLGSAIPTPGRAVRVGFAKNATDLDVQIMDFGWRR